MIQFNEKVWVIGEFTTKYKGFKILLCTKLDLELCLSAFSHQTVLLASCFRLLGLWINWSRLTTICPNLGLSLRFFSQQPSMSWCNTTGQSIGAGSL